MILVTGATGQLGSAVIQNLLKTQKPENIAALARDEKKAAHWRDKGISVRIGDYQDKASLDKAFQGVDRLLLITSNGENALEEHRNVIKAAKYANIGQLYYTSGARNTAVKATQLGLLWDSYVTTENDIKASGLTFTLLQCGLYAETIPFFLGEQVLESGIYFPAGDGKAAFAKRSEMGEAIAHVLTGNGHENKSYVITGDSTYSFANIAQILSGLAGKEIGYVSPDPSDYRRQLESYGVDETDIQFASLFAAIIKNHEYDVSDSTMADFLNRKPVSLSDYLRETYFRAEHQR